MKRRKLPIICITLAAVFALLGGIFRPVRVCCVLAALTALGIIVFDWLLRRADRRWARVAYRVLALLLASGLTVFAILEARIVSYAHTESDRPVAAVVILGAGVNGTQPSLSLYSRLAAALDYIADKPDIPIVVSGGRGSDEQISEAQCMADWLIQRGVAPERIWMEDRSHNTRENMENTRALLRENGIDTTQSVAVVTSGYHLYRARLYWGSPWMVPVRAELSGVYRLLNVNYYLREAFAVAKMLVFGG